MIAELDPTLARIHHLLLLDAAVSRDDVAALARSRYDTAGWAQADLLTLEPGAFLTGPWMVPPALRAALDSPDWAAQAYLCIVTQDRAGELPPDLAGLDPAMDAYPFATPRGIELDTLRFLQSAARRLAGALRFGGTAVVSQPDPRSAVDLTVYTPSRLMLEDVLAVLEPHGARLDSASRATFSLVLPPVAGRDDAGIIQVLAERHPAAPLALRGLEWAQDGARGHEVRWYPPEEFHVPGARLTASQRAIRAEAAATVERVARILCQMGEGMAVDDDGFVVAL